jgi:hypothetical protein
MACQGAVNNFEPFVEETEDIINDVLREERARERSRRSTSGSKEDSGGSGIEAQTKEGLGNFKSPRMLPEGLLRRTAECP